MKGTGRPPLPPLFAILLIITAAALEYFVPLPFRPASPLLKVVPFVLLAAAIALAGSAIRTMQRRNTTLDPRDTPSALVVTGPFRFSRNPIYLALLLVLAAFGVVFNSLWFFIAIPILMVLLSVLVIPREEQNLTSVFGADYAEYKRRVRRWI